MYPVSRWKNSIAATLWVAMISGVLSASDHAQATIPRAVSVVIFHAEIPKVKNYFPARVTATAISDVRPQIDGYIEKVTFQPGTAVAQGTSLFQVDPRPYVIELQRALARANEFRADIDKYSSRRNRLRDLVLQDAAARQEYDDARADLDRAEAGLDRANTDVKLARLHLEYCQVKAPISGITGRTSINPGALVHAYQTDSLVVIAQLDPIFVDLAATPATIADLRAQEHVRDAEVELQDENGVPYPEKARITTRDPTIDPSTGMTIIRALIPNHQGFLRPGMFLRAWIKRPMAGGLIPQTSVHYSASGQAFAFVVSKNGLVERKDVQVMGDQNPYWVVTGLDEGAQIILADVTSPRIGEPVKVIQVVRPLEQE